MINRVALFVVFAVAAGAATVALAGQPGPGQPRSLDDVQLELGSHGRTLRLVPQSFCASANEEPIALACGGVPIFHRRQGSLLVHRGTRMQLRFGAPVGRAYMTVKRPTRNGRLVELSRELPLERTSDPRIWRMRVPVPRGRRVIGVLAIYRDPVRLRLPGRLSAPFENASGEFDVYVRRHRHRAR